jgi:hypothetical protein
MENWIRPIVVNALGILLAALIVLIIGLISGVIDDVPGVLWPTIIGTIILILALMAGFVRLLVLLKQAERGMVISPPPLRATQARSEAAKGRSEGFERQSRQLLAKLGGVDAPIPSDAELARLMGEVLRMMASDRD